MKRLTTSVIWLLLALSFVNAKANDVPRQNENIIANYSLDEDDTLRYSNHYLFERAYNVIGDMLTDKRPVDFKKAVFAVENAFYGRKTGQCIILWRDCKDWQRDIAFDNYGVTVAAEHSCRYLCNQNLPDGSNNPSILVGAVLGGTGDITYNWSAESFYDQNTSTNFGSRGVDKYAKSFLELCLQKAGLLTKGLSISYEESQGNFGIWTVTRQKLCKDSKGNHYFTGSLKVNGKQTNIQLRSEAVYKDGKWVSNNIWKSNKYMELEK